MTDETETAQWDLPAMPVPARVERHPDDEDEPPEPEDDDETPEDDDADAEAEEEVVDGSSRRRPGVAREGAPDSQRPEGAGEPPHRQTAPVLRRHRLRRPGAAPRETTDMIDDGAIADALYGIAADLTRLPGGGRAGEPPPHPPGR